MWEVFTVTGFAYQVICSYLFIDYILNFLVDSTKKASRTDTFWCSRAASNLINATLPVIPR